jgi:hypothetical protein
LGLAFKPSAIPKYLILKVHHSSLYSDVTVEQLAPLVEAMRDAIAAERERAAEVDAESEFVELAAQDDAGDPDEDDD